MIRRMRSKWINTLTAIAVVLTTIFLPIAESSAQWRLFGGWRNSSNNQTMTTCDPNTGICTTTAVAAAPRVLAPRVNNVRYQGYANTVDSESSTGGVGAYQSSGSTGGVGSYGVVLRPGERIVSVSPATTTAPATKNLTALEDGSLLSVIMVKLAEDPNWTPGPQDDPLLHAAYNFLEAYCTQVEKGSFQRTALQPDTEEASPVVAKPSSSPSLQGRVTWQGPSTTAGLAKKFTWSPPALVASR